MIPAIVLVCLLLSSSAAKSDPAELVFEPIHEGDAPAPLYVLMVSHFDAPWGFDSADIAGFRSLSTRHPEMKWTHLFNPVAYTQSVPSLDEIEAYLFEAREVFGAEIGVHTHMYQSLVEAAGVTFRSSPSVGGTPPDCGSDPSGYAVPTTAYPQSEMRTILEFTIQTFQENGLGRPKTYCAGFYTASVTLQHVLASLGFTTSAAAFPPGTVYGAEYGPCWYVLSGWGSSSVTHTTPPYLVSAETVEPGGPPPYIWTNEGPLLEIPQVCKIDWMVSFVDMQNIFYENYEIAATGEPTAVCFAMHEILASDELSKFDQVLSFVDGFVEGPGEVPVIYATASEVREAFLEGTGIADSPTPPNNGGILLEQNSPNPLNTTAMIRYRTQRPGLVKLNIYDVQGHLVKSLVRGWGEAGPHYAVWDGSDDLGQRVVDGVYFCRLSVGDCSVSRKMVILAH